MYSNNYSSSKFTPEDMLQKADFNNYEKFKNSLVLIFELDDKIMTYMNNNNHIQIPIIDDNDVENSYNYVQWITYKLNTNVNNCIEKILSYLFCDKSCDFSDDEKGLRLLHLKKIMEKYGNAKTYFDKISERLWKKSSYLCENYDYYYSMASRKMVNILELQMNTIVIKSTMTPELATCNDYVTPINVSKLRQNGYAMIQGHPCKIVAMTTSKD